MKKGEKQNPSPQVPVYVDKVEVGYAEIPAPIPAWAFAGAVLGLIGIGIALYAIMRR